MTAADAPPNPADDALADVLEEVLRRRALGRPLDLDAYAERLGPQHADLLAILEADRALDEASLPAEEAPLPRAFGRYTLGAELGRGGVGVVHRAVDRELGRTVALKILKAGMADDPEVRARFQREVRICAALRHDNIVAVLDHGEVEGRAFYAMDLVEGESLDDLVKAGPVADHRDLARQLAGVADALHALHRLGDGKIVHRDVKPSNLLVRKDGRILLSDFGLARVDGGLKLTKSGQVVATPLFASAEQLLSRHDQVDARTDVYGLGASLYCAITGRPPYQATDWHELYRLVLKERPPSPRSINPKVDPDLERIVMKALEREPSDRFADAAAFAEQLRNYADGRAVAGGPVPALRHALRALRRRWKPIAAVALLLAGGAFAFKTWWENRDGNLRVSFGPPEEVPTNARVVIGGVDVGPMPWSGPLAPGTYEGHVVRDGRKVALKDLDGATKFTIHAGAPQVVIAWLDPSVGTGYVDRAMEDKFEGATDKASVTRATDGPAALHVLHPSAFVRVADMGRWVVQVGADFVAGGRLVLRRGTEELWSRSLGGDLGADDLACGTIPPDVVARLRADDVLTFGWLPPSAGVDAVLPEVTLLEGDPAADLLRRLDAEFVAAPPRLQVWARARALTSFSLHGPALLTLLDAMAGSKERVDGEELLRALQFAGLAGIPLRQYAEDLAAQGTAFPVCVEAR
jgi:tRNA A-37 threonylcarbamoyl transferase component Bud32